MSDFVEPAQSCALGFDRGEAGPRRGEGEHEEEGEDKPEGQAGVAIKRAKRSEGVPLKPSSKAVTISLQDCLACAGCVTSAETVLLAEQSGERLRSLLASGAGGEARVGASVAEASRAAAAHALGVSAREASLRLRAALRRAGAWEVAEQAVAGAISQREVLAELREREEGRGGKGLPLLVSACPGWVCYAEKGGKAQDAVPLLSEAKSPTSVASALLRRQFGATCHVSVEPCHDKKLEAARPGSATEMAATTQEALSLLSDAASSDPDEDAGAAHEEERLRRLCLDDPHRAALLGWRLGEDGRPRLLSCCQGWRYASSGGYATALLAPGAEMRPARNADLAEGEARGGGRVACVWGLRNVQTMMRRLRGGNCEWRLVEVMACPSGCLNGNGHPQGEDWTPSKAKRAPPERLALTEPPEVEGVPLDDVARDAARSLLTKEDLRLPEPFVARAGLPSGQVGDASQAF